MGMFIKRFVKDCRRLVFVWTLSLSLRWPNTPVFFPKTYIKSVLIVKFNMSRCSGNKN
jgi:hypothetical protein